MAKHTMDPWLEIQGMKKRMDKLMDDVRERFDARQTDRDRTALWQPVTDAFETPESYVVQVELAGMDRDQINLEIKDRELYVYGERRMLKDAHGSRYQVLERSYGPFARRFALPKLADPERIQATFVNGLLTVTIGKMDAGDRKQRIEVVDEE
ncbi:Hsp20/alpha crystallin family protein [Desulfovermiculus halophilus]|jgi:HSP20 family protein|uniref:Hsp20/alpha crystallin family protein n=1 Tax=Desulfovermiculus halophilus TaxID=339722 RepID=UPI000687B0EB|nr:Hsp20/alpha crystallin family protein [Desulfovermiculus halophilus]